jgi:hypothetical protein
MPTIVVVLENIAARRGNSLGDGHAAALRTVK